MKRYIRIIFSCLALFFLMSCGNGPQAEKSVILYGYQYSVSSKAPTAADVLTAMDFGLAFRTLGEAVESSSRSARICVSGADEIREAVNAAYKICSGGRYCILDVHTDDRTVWKKIARKVRTASHSLILEISVENADQDSLNAAFINVVRSSGKRNVDRVVAIRQWTVGEELQGQGATVALPEDVTPARIITDVVCKSADALPLIYECIQSHGRPTIVSVPEDIAGECIRDGFPLALYVFADNATAGTEERMRRCWDSVQLSVEKFDGTRVSTSGEYSLKVNGREVPVYIAKAEPFGGVYYYANFVTDGHSEVEVTSVRSLESARVLPADKYGIQLEKSAGHASFCADGPFRVSFERDGRNVPLLIFANLPVEEPQGQNVIKYGKGEHHESLIELTSGQTLYVEEGAVLHAAVHASGDNITICGLGIITGEDWKRLDGPQDNMIKLEGCTNVTVRDVTLTEPWGWALVTKECDGVLFDNVKLCFSNMINDDAIDLCNTRNAIVRNCFMRSKDDNIAVKGLNTDGLPCENITVRDCELWTDNANIFRIGYECDAPYFKNILGEKLDILHYSHNYRPSNKYWANAVYYIQPSGGITFSDIRFSNVRVNSDGQNLVFLKAESMKTGVAGSNYDTGGSLRGLVVENNIVCGAPGDSPVQVRMKGSAEDKQVEDVLLKDVSFYGKSVLHPDEDVQIQEYASAIKFE